MRGHIEEYGASHHVTEIYSPPRVTTWAANLRLIPGLVMDLTCVDPYGGLPWDFGNPDNAAQARRVVEYHQPRLLVCSPNVRRI